LSDNKIPSQQYAHKNMEYPEYNYINEDKRVYKERNNNVNSYHDTKDIKLEILHENKNITDLRTIHDIIPIHETRAYEDTKIINNDTIQDESNKINAGKQIFDEYIKEEHKKDMSNPNERYNPVKINFNINDIVKQKEEQIIGKINFIGKTKTSIIWNDGTRERILNANLNNELIKVEDNEKNKKIDNQSNIDKTSINKKSNVQSVSSTDDFYSQYTPEQLEEYKNKTINSIINAMFKRNQLHDNNEQNKKIAELKSCSVYELNNTLNDILKIKLPKVKMTEAEIQLDKLRHPEKYQNETIINDISDDEKIDLNKVESRTLNHTSNKSNINNITKKSNMNKTSKINTSHINKPKIQKFDNTKNEHELNFEDFKNITGIKQPIQIKNNQNSGLSMLTEKLSNLPWSNIPK